MSHELLMGDGLRRSIEKLIGFCKERLSPYKVPKSVEFRVSLPHTEIGKINKVQLRELIVEGAVL